MQQLFTLYIFPLVLMFLMFGLGLSLSGTDFTRVLRTPRPAIVGIMGHALLLPLVAFAVLSLWSFPPLIAGGLIILAACPGGVTSNTLVYAGRGDVALAVSLTAISSVVTVFTIPLVVGFGLEHFAGMATNVRPGLIDTMTRLGTVVLLPMFTGMAARQFFPGFAIPLEGHIRKLSAYILGALIFASGIMAIGGSGSATNDLLYATAAVLMLLAGVISAAYGLCALAGLDTIRTMTVVIETGVQNAVTAFLIGGTILKQPGFILTPAVYGFWMFAAAGLVIVLSRKRISQAEADGAPS